MKNDIEEEKENDKEEIIEDIKKEDNKSNDKALFLQRVLAFLIDSFIVLMVSSLIASPFVDSKKVDNINKQINELNNQIINNDIKNEEYLYRYMDVTYELARSNGFTTIINITICILYFVVFQIYKNGQTLGKKLMKIRVVSKDGDLTMNQMIFRSLICNSILVDILSLFFLIIAKKEVYFYCVGMFSFIYYVISFISIFMIMFGKDGTAVHDKLVHTRVVKLN